MNIFYRLSEHVSNHSTTHIEVHKRMKIVQFLSSKLTKKKLLEHYVQIVSCKHTPMRSAKDSYERNVFGVNETRFSVNKTMIFTVLVLYLCVN